MPARKLTRKRTIWVPLVTRLKATEGGGGTTWLAKELVREGVRARTERSAYIGHSTIVVAKGQLTAAKKILRQYGVRT